MSERLVVVVAGRRANFEHAALCICGATPRTQFFFLGFNETQPFYTLVESVHENYKNKRWVVRK
jgi:hypothetical protein